MQKLLFHFGRYLLLLKQLVINREKFSVYWGAIMRESVAMGVGSVLIVLVISLFVGGVTTLNTAFQLTTALLPRTVIGAVVSLSAILELAPSITSLVLAGKIGSAIAGELGTMRVSEQIDALDVMGVNSASYLVLPKVIAGILVFPMLIIISAFLMHVGGFLAGDISGSVTMGEFARGAQENFNYFNVKVMLIKATAFGLIITSISAYHGYHVRGGALEVGEASTAAVVFSSISVLVADYLLAQYLL